MELRPRKQFRTENTSNIGPSPNSCKAKSASVKEDNQTIPGLVSHIFLANLRDVGLLKTCRLVCKSWNIDATVSLRAWQFPKVSSVGIDVPRFCESAITTIYEAFPKITALRLNGSCDYYCFSGTPHPDPNMPFEMTHGHKSIMDFLELEKISLGPYFILEPNMMSLCLPRIPKLKHLEFYWGKSLSASLLRDSVGHLETIIISNSTKDEYRADMAQVSKMVPSVVGR
ncbi:unnamed protein product [Allacma fusca]|uniref:F-box domain-containing protein n=1 Tax=Allacma fusca TaxID=39272 RepID=A0A8J2LJH2_9HEXA|nr:unnamed protein product [Allacma fusca]